MGGLDGRALPGHVTATSPVSEDLKVGGNACRSFHVCESSG